MMNPDAPKRKPIGYWIKTVLFFLLSAVIVAYIVVEAFVPNKTVDFFGFKPYIVITESMEPEINPDDVVVVKRADPDELSEGDIITFLVDLNNDGEDDVVTHYVDSIEENDSNELEIRTHRHFEDSSDISQDPWVLGEEDLLGEHLFTIPNIGVFIRFLQSPFGIAALVVNIGIITGIVMLLKSRTETPKSGDDSES